MRHEPCRRKNSSGVFTGRAGGIRRWLSSGEAVSSEDSARATLGNNRRGLLQVEPDPNRAVPLSRSLPPLLTTT